MLTKAVVLAKATIRDKLHADNDEGSSGCVYKGNSERLTPDEGRQRLC